MQGLGSVKTISLNLSSPIAFKAVEMNVNALTMLTGKNGVGKSFINVMVYAVTSVINFRIFDNEHDSKLVCDEIFSHCFDNFIVGEIKFTYSSGASVEIELDETGKCSFIQFNAIDNLIPTKVIYMSSQFRLFTGIKMYLQIRKSFGGSNEEKIMKLSEMFKLYDIQTIEGLVANMPYKFDEKILSSLNTISDNDDVFKNMAEINVDLLDCDFNITMKDGSIKSATSLGAGHQAILNMCLITNTNT